MIFQSLDALTDFVPAFTAFIESYQRAAQISSNRLNGWPLDDRDPQVITQLMPVLEWLYRYYYRAQTDGWEHIPEEGKVLLIGSHNGGLAAPDMYIAMQGWFSRFGPERLVYAHMNPKIWQVLPGFARMASQFGAVRAHPKTAIAALHRNASLLIYPGGAQDVFRPYSQRNQIYFHERRGFIKLALREEVPIVPIISHGAHSTLIVLADIYPQLQQLHQQGMPWLLGIDPEVCPIYLGWPWGVAIGPLPNIPFPMPVYTRVCPAIVFKRYGAAAAKDADYVDECYHRVHQIMQSELDQLAQEQRKRCSLAAWR